MKKSDYEKNIQTLKRKVGCYKTRLSRLRKKQGQSTTPVSIYDKLTTKCSKFFKEQISVAGKPRKGITWSDETKSFALQIKGASKKAYRILRKIFILPTERTLSNILQKLNIREGFHTCVLFALKVIAKGLPQLDRLVVICFDEISLKENISYDVSNDGLEGVDAQGQISNHAGVFMLRSVTRNWKQPFGYFLTSGTMKCDILKDKLVESVKLIQNTGYIPTCIVLDQGSNNAAAVRKLGVTLEKPYIEVNNSKIYILYDTPHLLKNIRNNLKNNGFHIKDKLAAWCHIRELYKQDSKRKIRMVPKLTELHLDLSAFSTMKVSLATQVNYQ